MANAVGHAQAQSVDELRQLSIDDLANIQITSVSKEPERLNTAAAAVYVISHDDIMRSGATSIPEILRLAPNLYVAEITPSQYVITARGFSGNFADQNFSNKLLVLVDGRSVYSPLYSGVYWDTVYVPPEDIERIEVVSGPGATMWGANAVNGVINIITRSAGKTQGGSLDVGMGNYENIVSLQYGGSMGEDLDYRVYGRDFSDRSFSNRNGASTHDGWSAPQGGFRIDWTPSRDSLSIQGDIYNGDEQQLGASDTNIEGRNLEATWQHTFTSGSNLQVLSYYDESERNTNGGGGFSLSTYDLEVQQTMTAGDWNSFVFGAGERFTDYAITGRISPASSLLFIPSDGTLNLGDVFAQDRISLADPLTLILGLKLEDDPWSGWSPLPTARLSWKVDEDNTLWAAVSRAIRAPTPFDTDVVEKIGPINFIDGNPDFLPETVTAYELGYRGELSQQASLSVSGYFNEYDHLRTIEFNPLTLLPLHWGNMMEGSVLGLEAWGDYHATDWWRLSAGVQIQTEDLRFAPGASQLLGLEQAGDDAHHQAMLRSSMNISDDVTFDSDFRYVGTLPDPRVPAYVELNSRLGWKLSEKLELSLSGFNLLHAHHQEFTIPPADEVKRNFLVETRWRF